MNSMFKGCTDFLGDIALWPTIAVNPTHGFKDMLATKSGDPGYYVETLEPFFRWSISADASTTGFDDILEGGLCEQCPFFYWYSFIILRISLVEVS